MEHIWHFYIQEIAMHLSEHKIRALAHHSNTRHLPNSKIETLNLHRCPNGYELLKFKNRDEQEKITIK